MHQPFNYSELLYFEKKINLYKMQELHFDMFDVILNDYVLWYIAKDFLCLRADHPVQQSGHL